MQEFIAIFEDFLVNTLADEILSDEAENKRFEVINTLERLSSNLKVDENEGYVEMKRCFHEPPYKPYVEIIANVGSTDCQYQEHGSSKACNSESENLYQCIREFQADTDSESDDAVDGQEEFISELKSLQGRSSLHTKIDSFHSGYLLKAKRKLFKQHWDKVYVVIRDGMALLYESENAERAMEIIILTGYDMMEIEVKTKRMEIQLIPVNNVVKRPRPDHRFRCELDDFYDWQKALSPQKWTKNRDRRSRLLLQIAHLFDSFSDDNFSDKAGLPVIEEKYCEGIDCSARSDNELKAKYQDKDPEKTSGSSLEKPKESGSNGGMRGPGTKKATFRTHLEQVVSQNSPQLPYRNIPPRPAPRQKRQ
eukprot:gene13547-4435_t